ncbi:MAG: hypothetical protein FWE58_05905 [Methanobrevibacter sp.]|nr:hypothetical protein [Methanobrevibacter sp.]
MILSKKSFKIVLILLIFLIIVVGASFWIFSEDIFNLNDKTNKTDYKPLFINNTNAPDFVTIGESYGESFSFSQGNIIETEKNTISTTEESKNYTFITEYFLPTLWKALENYYYPSQYWYNSQAIAIDGKYMYILSSSGYNENKGFIVRYDMELLNTYNANNEKGIWALRKLGLDIYHGNKLTNKQKRLKNAIKIGPVFNTGHGQSLSINPKTKTLWLWQDDGSGNTLKLMRINNETLKQEKIYEVSAKLNNNSINSFRNLAFDSEGNFYTDYVKKTERNPNGYVTIFTGNIENDTVKIKPLLTIQNRPGTYSQSLAVNPSNNRLYLVSDGVFYTLPIEKLRNRTLSPDDFRYYIFDTSREFEGVSFDNKGNSYLLVLRGTEVLKSV